MKSRLITLSAVITAFFLVMPAFAKRSPPKPVEPVAKDGIEYSAGPTAAPEGFVVATWTDGKRKVEIWRRQIYTIKHEYKLGLERDVQTCFITKLEFENGKLMIWNERSGEFELDLDTLEVKVLKGQALIDFTDRDPPKE